MRRASIDFQVGHNIRTEAIMHDHTPYRVLQCALRESALKCLTQRRLLQTTRILAMAIIDFLIQTPARDSNLPCIDDDHEISALEMWGKCWFMLATQNLRDLRCQATQDLTLCVDNIPFGVQISGFGAICLHHYLILQILQDNQPVPGTAHVVGPLNRGASYPHFAQWRQIRQGSAASALPATMS